MRTRILRGDPKGRLQRFNRKIGLLITKAVGTMWAAYGFALLTFVSLPSAIKSRDPLIIVSWIAQTFLQLVLLAVIMVGQGIASEKTERTIQETHEIAALELAEIKAIAKELHVHIVPTETLSSNSGEETF